MKTIGIYTGRFQPPHRGHLEVYKQLKQLVGIDTFVVTSNKVELPDSPLSFAEKEMILVKHGIPSSHVVQVKNGYTPVEVISKFPGAAAIFALGEKDKQRLIGGTQLDKQGKEIWVTRKGALAYYQPYESNRNNMETADKRGYVIIVNDVKIDGKNINGTDVRNALGSNTQSEDNKRKFFQWAFGWFDASLFKLLVDKFSARDVEFPTKEPSITKEYIESLIKECILELMGTPPVSSTPTGDVTPTDLSSQNTEQDLMKAKIDAEKSKKQVDRDLDSKKKELTFQKKNVDNLRKDKIPDLEKQRQDLNKKIAGQI